jgi:hypothetical protein
MRTRNDYRWRLGYLEPFFGRYRLREITPRLVDRFRDELHEQAQAIRGAQERARAEGGRRPLTETVTDKRGRTYERRRRPLSNSSINAMIALLGQILQQAVDYELIDPNPVRVGGRSAPHEPGLHLLGLPAGRHSALRRQAGPYGRSCGSPMSPQNALSGGRSLALPPTIPAARSSPRWASSIKRWGT